VPTLTPCLFVDRPAVEAADFSGSVQPDSHVDSVARTEADTPSMQEGM